jgi:hypothetical protein
LPGFLTDYANNKVLDQVFGASAWRPPATLYVGLSTSIAVKSGDVSEPPDGGYARVAVANDLSNFPSALGGTKSNGTAVTFATPTANWGTVTTVFIADAPTGGNVIAMADLPVSKAINSGTSVPTIAVGALFLSHS